MKTTDFLSKPTWILAACMVLLTATGVWAGYAGWGLERPEKQPISVREHSIRTGPAHFHGRSFGGRSWFWGK